MARGVECLNSVAQCFSVRKGECAKFGSEIYVQHAAYKRRVSRGNVIFMDSQEATPRKSNPVTHL